MPPCTSPSTVVVRSTSRATVVRIKGGVEQRQRAAEAITDEIDARRTGQRDHRADAAPDETVDVVGEIGEPILARRRTEIGDVDVEASRGDMARERAARQQIDDEVAAHGRGDEQHRRAVARLARFVEQSQKPQLVLDDRPPPSSVAPRPK